MMVLKNYMRIVLYMSMILGLVFILSTNKASAKWCSVRSDDYEYSYCDDNKELGAVISKIYNYEETVVIPAEIDGYKVKSIGSNPGNIAETIDEKGGIISEKTCVLANGNESLVKKLVIPESVESIRDGAFYNMKSLEEIEFEHDKNNNKTFIIGRCNFMGIKRLKKVEFPRATDLDDMSFHNAKIDKLVVNEKLGNSIIGHKSDFHANNIIIKNYNNNSQYCSLSVVGCKVDKITVDKSVSKVSILRINECKILEIKNAKAKVTVDNYITKYGKVYFAIDNIKHKTTKKGHIYTWKKPNINVTDKVDNKKINIRYIISGRTKAGKMKRLKKIRKENISFDKKQDINVEAICIIPHATESIYLYCD